MRNAQGSDTNLATARVRARGAGVSARATPYQYADSAPSPDDGADRESRAARAAATPPSTEPGRWEPAANGRQPNGRGVEEKQTESGGAAAAGKRP